MDVLKTIALILVIIGGLNWGLVGLLELDVIVIIFGEMSILSRIIYGLMGLAAAYIAFTSFTETKPEPKIEARTEPEPKIEPKTDFE